MTTFSARVPIFIFIFIFVSISILTRARSGPRHTVRAEEEQEQQRDEDEDEDGDKTPTDSPALPAAWSGEDTPFVTVKDGRFVDQDGRQVILHGVNVGEKHPPYVSWHTAQDYGRMREWGFNCVRLLTVWAAIEPECGHYDEEYLERLDERIAWAKEHGLFVVLDMHQDLYGEKPGWSDGAPVWATLDDGLPHQRGQVWSDAYWTSQAIQAAFDNFWANKPGPDGVGIQERFALAWRHVAARYADEPAIVGFDLLNEPFIGSPILMAALGVVPQLGKMLAPKDAAPLGLLDLTQMLAEGKGRSELVERLKDTDVYRSLIDATAPAFQVFERGNLRAMHQRVANAIREVDGRHVLFLEPSVSSSGGVPSALQPVSGPDGEPDPYQALAPHAYDIVVDTPDAWTADEGRLALILDRHAALTERHGWPLLLGEWGAFYGSPKVVGAARVYTRLIEERLASDTYWSFSRKDFDQTAHFKLLQRPYPMAVAGTLLEYRFDPDSQAFECRWRERSAVTAPTQVYVPRSWYPDGYDAACVPACPSFEAKPVSPGSVNLFLLIPPDGGEGERTLILRPKAP